MAVEQAISAPRLCVQEHYLVLGDFAADSELLARQGRLMVFRGRPNGMNMGSNAEAN